MVTDRATIFQMCIPCAKALLWYKGQGHLSMLRSNIKVLFLAHLSTTCSRGAFRVVMCPSCIVNNFFKHLLLPNHWANLDQTWQECSLGGPLQNCSQNLIPSKTLVAMATKLNFLSNSLKSSPQNPLV